jgi:hypothetical protein
MTVSLMHGAGRTLATAVLGVSLFGALPVLAADDTTSSLNAAELKSITSDNSASMPMGKGMHDMDKGVEGRIRHLHDQLKVTPDEEDAWGKVAQVMRDNAAKMKAAYEARMSNTNLSAPDDIKAEQKLLETHTSTLSDFSDAFSTFYNKLTSEQQKNADMLFSHMEQHHEHEKHDHKKPQPQQ